MAYLYTYFLDEANAQSLFEELRDYWTHIMEGQPATFTVTRNEGRVFIDAHFYEGIGINQYDMSLILYRTETDKTERGIIYSDAVNRFALRLDYTRLQALAHPKCYELYEGIKETILNKMDFITRSHKLNLLLDE